MEDKSRSLEDKLNTLAAGQAIGLTAAETAVYGVEYADVLPEDDNPQEEADHGE